VIIMSNVYSAIPQIGQWKHDSSVTFAIRSHDSGLVRIDKFLEEYNRTSKSSGSQCGFVLCDLFLATHAWLKNYYAMSAQLAPRAVLGGKQPAPKVMPGFANLSTACRADAKKRYPAVVKLFDIVLKTLGSLEISKNEVKKNENGENGYDDTFEVKMDGYAPPVLKDSNGDEVDATFGVRYSRIVKMVMDLVSIDMEEVGRKTDRTNGMYPFTANQLIQYRVWFKGGKAYQTDWWSGKPSLRLRPANSRHAWNPNDPGAWGTTKNYGPFVMTMDLEMYMTQHSREFGVFHSNYVNQKPVLMAGTMLIENGIIKAIRSDSGHYQPNSHEFNRFINHLSALGVHLSNIAVYDWEGKPVDKANRVLDKWKNPPVRMGYADPVTGEALAR
jgi:hypothetical protein